MITTDDSQGTTVITLCKYDEYNSPVSAKDTVKDTDISLLFNELKELKTQLATQQKTQGRHSDDTKYNKENNINNNISPSIPQTGEAVACIPDTRDKGGVEKEKTWRNDFETYLNLVRTAYQSICNDKDLLDKQQRYYPGVNIKLSIEKSCANYWATEAGWKKKKGSRSKEIDMKMTLINAININKVYDAKEQTETKRYDNGDFLR